MKAITIKEHAGVFAENKDIARALRKERIEPALDDGEVVLDFTGVEGATQSFIHALISELIRQRGVDVIDQLVFKDCNETVRQIITIVIDYMQESV